ncbi:MAG: DUF2892 domain-containing protein [Candidatus Nanohaloarchaea archaeon]|nr:DUF2892 domain-containing protein [Candidatus Nanohaloarchaea archaeon]
MEKNVGETDKEVRLGVGTVLLALGLAGYTGYIPVAVGPLPQALTSAILAIIGAVSIFTGVTQRCLLYRLIGRNTCEA